MHSLSGSAFVPTVVVLALMGLPIACTASPQAPTQPSTATADVRDTGVAVPSPTPTAPGWFSENKDVIDGVSSIATLVSVIVAAIALAFTGRQVRRNIRTNRAKAIYEIQRDAREAGRLMRTDSVVAKEIFDIDPNRGGGAEAAARQIFNFYASVFQQKDLVGDEYWNLFENELSELFQRPSVRDYWEKVKRLHDADYVRRVDKLVSRASSNADTTPNRQGERH